jgi:hypothetical protein
MEFVCILSRETLTKYATQIDIHTYKFYWEELQLHSWLLADKMARFTSKERKPNREDTIFITKNKT